ncbi:MAG: hypothetical protein ABIS35_03205 [Terracoccus sp.]
MDEQPSSEPEAGLPTDAADLAAHLARVRAHRAELAESLHAVDDALASDAQGAAWAERLETALAELGHDLRDHVEITEGDQGLYALVRRDSPRLATPVERLVTEHARHRAQVDGLLAALEHDDVDSDLPALRAEVTALLAQLRLHRQRGRDLVHEAYDIDLGGSG